MAIDLDGLKRVLEYAEESMTRELLEQQEQLLRIERFGKNAVYSKHVGIAKPFRHLRTPEELQKRIDDKCALIRETEALIEKIKDATFERDAKAAKEAFSKSIFT